MTITDARRLAKYFGNLYKITQDPKDRESVSYLRTILLKHNMKNKITSSLKTIALF